MPVIGSPLLARAAAAFLPSQSWRWRAIYIERKSAANLEMQRWRKYSTLRTAWCPRHRILQPFQRRAAIVK